MCPSKMDCEESVETGVLHLCYAALETVDYVVVSEESGKMDHTRLTSLLRPDVYVVPETDTMLEEKRRMVESAGGRFHTCRRLPPGNLKGGISTTSIAEKTGQEP